MYLLTGTSIGCHFNLYNHCHVSVKLPYLGASRENENLVLYSQNLRVTI